MNVEPTEPLMQQVVSEASDVYRLNPLSWSDGVPVFVPDVSVDEYAEGDPYRSEYTAELHWDRFRVDAILSALREGESILDAACGSGDMTRRLADLGRVFAYDYSVSAIRMAKEKGVCAEFAVADALNLPYRDDLVDVVVMANLFEHVDDPSRLLREAARVLKPGGRVVVSTPSRYRTVNARRAIRGLPVRFNSPLHVTEYTIGQVKEISRREGFSIAWVKSNLKCRTPIGTAAAHAMDLAARAVGSHQKFGDPTIYCLELSA